MLPMTNPTVADILAPKPEANPRIYAYAIADAAHADPKRYCSKLPLTTQG